METKKYWQILDGLGRTELYVGAKPKLRMSVNGYKLYTPTNTSRYVAAEVLFPVPLKPLQIAEITVNENGTWSYEIEREEGWYMARGVENDFTYFLRYSDGKFYNSHGEKVHTKYVTISQTRIPDECII